MMLQAPEMQEGANNAKNEERDATAARMVALRAKVAAKQLEEKQAASTDPATSQAPCRR